MWPTSDIFTMASVVKKALSTAPMLMYQHSRSGVSSRQIAHGAG